MSDYEQDRKIDEAQDEQQWLRALLLRDSERFQLPDSLKSENLIHKLEALDAAQSEAPQPVVLEQKRRGKTAYFKYLSYAACIAVVLFGWYNAQQTQAPTAAPEAVMIKADGFDQEETEAAPMMAAQASAAQAAEIDVAQPVAESYAQVYEALNTVWSNQMAGYAQNRVTGGGMDDRVMVESEDLMMDVPMAEAPMNPATSGGGDVYQTNIQIAGVDEADIVKTDGAYIYQYRFDSETGGAQIAISSVSSLRLQSTILLPEYADAELYLAGNRLIVVQSLPEKEVETLLASLDRTFSEYLGIQPADSGQDTLAADSDNVIVPDYYYRGRRGRSIAMTEALTFDISDHKLPREIGRYRQDGRYVSSRLTRDTLYLVTNKTVSGDVITGADSVYHYLPVTGTKAQAAVLPAQDIIIPPYLENLNYAVVTALDVSNQKAETKAVLGMADQIMMSQNSLYLTATVTSADRQGRYERSTGITRFSASGGGLKYLASGKVAGYIDNQFSLDEHEGNLRIATTSYNDSSQTVNNLYVLDGQLQPVGSVEGLAEGERIYSVRYVGETAYVVTFRETDPLFVIDLSNPAKPQVKGELKLPGFSEYLHPIDKNTLLGFGMNTIATPHGGVVQDGLKLTLFDVTNPAAPKEKASYLLGNMGSTSEALQNHKALMFHPQQQLIGFPVTLYTAQGATAENPWAGSQTLSFAGYLVIKIKSDGFEVVGTLPNEGRAEGGFMRYDSGNSIQRGIYVGKTLYTIAPGRITAYTLDGFEPAGELRY